METQELIYFAPANFIISKGTFYKDGVIVHHIDGQFYAYHSACPHMPDKGNLQSGRLNEGTLMVECPEHKWKFSIATGENVISQLRKYGCLTLFDVIVEDGSVYLKSKIHEEHNLHN